MTSVRRSAAKRRSLGGRLFCVPDPEQIGPQVVFGYGAIRCDVDLDRHFRADALCLEQVSNLLLHASDRIGQLFLGSENLDGAPDMMVECAHITSLLVKAHGRVN